jgi:uncharacterized protein (DUF2062 family)
MYDGAKARKIHKKRWTERFRRLIRLRLIVPIKRSRRPPEYSARGSLVGLVWAFTPLIGFQIYLCLATWIVARKLFKWDFSLAVACAWTWTTNMLTMVPAYYMFYVTGYYLLGFQDNAADYAGFAHIFREAADVGVWNALKVSVTKCGLLLSVGCLPWAAFFGWLGYSCTLKYTLMRRKTQMEKFGRGKSRMGKFQKVFITAALALLAIYPIAAESAGGEQMVVVTLQSNATSGNTWRYSVKGDGLVAEVPLGEYEEYLEARDKKKAGDDENAIVISYEVAPGTTPFFFRGERSGEVEIHFSYSSSEDANAPPEPERTAFCKIKVNPDKTLEILEKTEK